LAIFTPILYGGETTQDAETNLADDQMAHAHDQAVNATIDGLEEE